MEVISLVSPVANTFVYNVISQHLVVGEERSLANVLMWVAVFSAALFFDPESRHGGKLRARLVFLAVVTAVALYHWHLKQEEAERRPFEP